MGTEGLLPRVTAAVICVAGAVGLSGCSAQNMSPEPSPSQEREYWIAVKRDLLEVPVSTWRAGGRVGAETLSGVLVLVDGCVVVETATGEVVLPVWPPGTYADHDPDFGEASVHSDGAAFATGATVVFSGVANGQGGDPDNACVSRYADQFQITGDYRN